MIVYGRQEFNFFNHAITSFTAGAVGMQFCNGVFRRRHLFAVMHLTLEHILFALGNIEKVFVGQFV